MRSPPDRMVGRAKERAALLRFVEGLAERPRVLILEGEAGIGKTTLWRAGMDAAAGAGHRVLVSRPAERETTLTYSAIGDLLGDVFDEALADAPAPQRRALEIALLRRQHGTLQPDQRAIALGVLEAFRTLSASSPVVIGLDDTQWLDDSSARALSFAMRRLDGHPVGVLAARRLAPGSVDPLDLMGAIADGDTVRLHVGPLGVTEVSRILRVGLERPLSPPLVARVHEAARGNPFFALEIAHALRGAEPAAGTPFPIAGEARDVLRERLDRLSTDARDIALVVSAMARPTLGELRIARPDRTVTERGLTEAQDAGIILVEGDHIGFVHPLLGSAAYWSAAEATRHAVHARLAEVTPGLEERARHVALTGTGPDPERASLVQEAATHARRRGAPLAAADLWELAAELTPGDDEAGRCRRMRSAALERWDAGDVPGARARLETLIQTTTSRQQRAMTRMEVAIRSYNDVDRVDGLLRAALPDLGEEEFFTSIVHSNLAWVAVCRLEPALALDHVRTAIRFAERSADPWALRVALDVLGEAESLLGLETEATMRRASAIGVDLGPGETVQPARIRASQLLREGRIEEARVSARQADRHLVETGLELMRHDTLPLLSEVECGAGEWAAAARHADEGYDIVLDAGLEELRDQMLFAKARVAALTGRTDDARRYASEGVSLAAARGNRAAEVENRSVLGFLAVSIGDPLEAVRVLEPAERLLASSSVAEPGAFPFVPDLAEALVTVGRLERAKEVVDRLHDQGAALDRPLALATAARCRGLIAAGLGDPQGALLELEGALATHERISIPFESARTRLIQGETLRRMKRKREARDALERARSRFDELGAALWTARTDGALARIGGRTASPTDLSETERRVADVVALGLTNKETADRLFMSVNTVESNLRRIYRKLGIRSRAELATRHRPPVPPNGEGSDPIDRT